MQFQLFLQHLSWLLVENLWFTDSKFESIQGQMNRFFSFSQEKSDFESIPD